MPKRKSGGARGSTPAGPRSFECKLCGRRVRIPDGWTRGPAVRKHYWRKHRDHMIGKSG